MTKRNRDLAQRGTGAITATCRAEEATSSPPAGSVDLVRERGREAPAPGAIDGARNSTANTLKLPARPYRGRHGKELPCLTR
jgi:hypothetical protein